LFSAHFFLSFSHRCYLFFREGVTKNRNKFKARVYIAGPRKNVPGRHHHVGTFDTPKEAALAYDRAAIQAQRPQDTLNFPATKTMETYTFKNFPELYTKEDLENIAKRKNYTFEELLQKNPSIKLSNHLQGAPNPSKTMKKTMKKTPQKTKMQRIFEEFKAKQKRIPRCKVCNHKHDPGDEICSKWCYSNGSRCGCTYQGESSSSLTAVQKYWRRKNHQNQFDPIIRRKGKHAPDPAKNPADAAAEIFRRNYEENKRRREKTEEDPLNWKVGKQVFVYRRYQDDWMPAIVHQRARTGWDGIGIEIVVKWLSDGTTLHLCNLRDPWTCSHEQLLEDKKRIRITDPTEKKKRKDKGKQCLIEDCKAFTKGNRSHHCKKCGAEFPAKSKRKAYVLTGKRKRSTTENERLRMEQENESKKRKRTRTKQTDAGQQNEEEEEDDDDDDDDDEEEEDDSDNKEDDIDKPLKYKGVQKKGKRYKAQISVNGKTQALGTFDTSKEAAKAYDLAYIQAGRSTTKLNFLDQVPKNYKPKKKKLKK